MQRPDDIIESAITLLTDLVGESPALEHEFAETRTWFGAAPTDESERVLAHRRHLEWFLMEHPSPSLDGVPAEALKDQLRERGGDEPVQVLLGSRAGAFEVTSILPGQGIWVQDLFGGGQLPLAEPDAAHELTEGDLLVGRVFPAGSDLSDGTEADQPAMHLLRLSPAAAHIRDSALVEALRKDIETSRASRRGVLRVEQLELERLFFGAAESPQSRPEGQHDRERVTTFSPLAAARTSLSKLGLDEVNIVAALDLLEELAHTSPERSDVVTEILNSWAFETEIDLADCQRILAGLWSTLTGPEPKPDQDDEDSTATPGPHSDAQGRGDARTALLNFDASRAAGETFDEVFTRLEADLGLSDKTEDDTGDPTPDFPGVVGAMVEEFLWDTTRAAHGHAPPEETAAGLRLFARYGAAIGVFENLGPRELVDFAGRWLLDEDAVGDAREARTVLEALAAFCRWTEKNHNHALWTPFAESWERLNEALPRLLCVRALDRDELPPSKTDPFEIEAIEGTTLRVRSLNGDPIESVHLRRELTAELRAGDIVHMHVDTSGAGHLGACYPGELRRLLETRSTQNADQGN